MPSFLSSLLHRTRAGILAMLLVVLPLQGVAQIVAGLQGHRHVHTADVHEGHALSDLAASVRSMLSHLHAAQDPRLQGPRFAWIASRGPMEGMHEHGGVFHKHSHDTADVMGVGDAADESVHAGATAFLAWLPASLALPAGEGSDAPTMAVLDWRDRVVKPQLAPPRGI